MNPAMMAERYARPQQEFHRKPSGMIVWTCEHGVEHPVWFGFAPIIRHSCDGCCKRLVRVDVHRPIDRKHRWMRRRDQDITVEEENVGDG